jgi:hypothetical protein
MSKLRRTVHGYPVQDCAAHWRRHRFWLIASFAALIALTGIAVYVAGFMSHKWEVYVCLGVGACLIELVAQQGRNFRCPHCGWKFYPSQFGGFGYNIFKKKCDNCGLRRWQCDEVS